MAKPAPVCSMPGVVWFLCPGLPWSVVSDGAVVMAHNPLERYWGKQSCQQSPQLNCPHQLPSTPSYRTFDRGR